MLNLLFTILVAVSHLGRAVLVLGVHQIKLGLGGQDRFVASANDKALPIQVL